MCTFRCMFCNTFYFLSCSIVCNCTFKDAILFLAMLSCMCACIHVTYKIIAEDVLSVQNNNDIHDDAGDDDGNCDDSVVGYDGGNYDCCQDDDNSNDDDDVLSFY